MTSILGPMARSLYQKTKPGGIVLTRLVLALSSSLPLNNEESNKRAQVPMYDLLDIACAAHAALELEKISDKEHAFKHVLTRTFGYMSPEAKAEFNAWVDRKGWRAKERIILAQH